MKSLALVIRVSSLLLLCQAAIFSQKSNHPYTSLKPLSDPTIFGYEIISTGDYESHPAFTPDGKTLYFVKSSPNFNYWTILVSQYRGGKWSQPEVAPFSGRYSDADPFITPDGSTFYFISTRPIAGQPDSSATLDIWKMERLSNGSWGEPENLEAPVNSPGSEWYPTVTGDGTLYFGSDREGGKGRTDLYRCRIVDGKYQPAENLGDSINTQFQEFEPWIAPDESYLIYMGGGPNSIGGTDLFISYNKNGAWTKGRNLGDKINSPGIEYSPKFSPDGLYFFWTSTRGFSDKPLPTKLRYNELLKNIRSPRNGLGDIYYIDASTLPLDQ